LVLPMRPSPARRIADTRETQPYRGPIVPRASSGSERPAGSGAPWRVDLWLSITAEPRRAHLPHSLPISDSRCAALPDEVAAGLEASSLSAEVVRACARHSVRRHTAVLLRRVEAAPANGPYIAFIAIMRLLAVRDSARRLENPIAIGPCVERAARLHGRRWRHTIR
jgi:hypothetical protein